MTAAQLRDDEPDVLVCRSRIDPNVWFCSVADMLGDGAADLSDFESPGRLRAVQCYAEEKYAEGRACQWEREGASDWRLRIKDSR